ncbi:class I SAM-dependent methyltransferase [Nocardia panacis]|uniref:Class I SAM-dependent methyltransferase n=1 Tax=Nocardia panacis TaxID=2340916 RepID=A0A3A4KV37_9NOCA|nr:class I SAM-dependent methyltransferase [Nocardia panacis]RJO77236.1 class I SAM-dependent methyltransferase [Nocardia panacis]
MPTIAWSEEHIDGSAREDSVREEPRVVDDRTGADTAYGLVRAGTVLLWRGDFHNGRQLLNALRRRIERRTGRPSGNTFDEERAARRERSRLLEMLVVLLDADYCLDLPRAPDVRQACRAAYGPPGASRVISFTELLGVLGAHQWRVKGVEVAVLGARVHPHYGVFSPVRGEYVDLVAAAPWKSAPRRAFDLGTGTGVLAAVLARRGCQRITATDGSLRALDCARANIGRLGLSQRVEIVGPTLYPEGCADLIVCNPPWLPGQPASLLERGVYDPDSTMLCEFLAGLPGHLTSDGEGWLVMSDLAEHLGLRSRAELLARIEAAGLRVVDRLDTKPRHSRSRNTADPLYAARRAETTSLWRLAVSG